MPAARLPNDEMQRLEAVRRSRILEGSPDARLDRIVRRAANLFKAPIAAVSVLDRTRQVFKASVGLGVPQTSRDVAFCGYTILRSSPMVVLDALKDVRFVDNSLVLGLPSIRFYAGVPVFGPDMAPLGALCVIDTKVRPGVLPATLTAFEDMAEEVSLIVGAPPQLINVLRQQRVVRSGVVQSPGQPA